MHGICGIASLYCAKMPENEMPCWFSRCHEGKKGMRESAHQQGHAAPAVHGKGYLYDPESAQDLEKDKSKVDQSKQLDNV